MLSVKGWEVFALVYFKLGNKIFKKITGTPIASDPAPFFANLILFDPFHPMHLRKVYQNKNYLKFLLSHFALPQKVGFMKEGQVFIKSCEAPRRVTEIKI